MSICAVSQVNMVYVKELWGGDLRSHISYKYT